MRTKVIAVLQLALILPAALFMSSLVVRNLVSLQYEPARTAQQIVMWYAGRVWTLRVLLFALLCIVLVSGCVALRNRNRGAEQQSTQHSLASSHSLWPMHFVSVMTVASAGILAIVPTHVLTH